MPAEHATRFDFRRLSLEDALAAAQNPDLDMTTEFVRDAFARGDICVGAYDGNKLVAYTWRTLNCGPITDTLWLELLDRSHRYGYKGLVLSDYRGTRLNMSVARFWDRHFVAMGIQWTVTYVDLHNLASMRSTFRDDDRKRIGFAGYLHVGRRVWPFRSPGVRRIVALRIRDGARSTRS